MVSCWQELHPNNDALFRGDFSESVALGHDMDNTRDHQSIDQREGGGILSNSSVKHWLKSIETALSHL